MMKRILSWILLLTLMAGLMPGGTIQAYAQGVTPITVTSTTVTADPGLPENKELLDGYLYKLFYDVPTTYRRMAGDQLEGDEKVLYDALVPIIRKLAAGERASTEIAIGQPVDFEGTHYPVDASANFTCRELSKASLGKLVAALLTDLPYELYWYDKVTGCMTNSFADSKMLQIRFFFAVAENYCAGDLLTVDTSLAKTATAAAGNSKQIVAQYANAANDYEKLLGYKNEICDLVTYDHAAADGNYFSQYDDPWQLIHVFDGDPGTNVVCEGYSKAFMYLCEQTAFTEDVSCITATGDMSGGLHMWNIVRLLDKNYLVDVTNSESNTVGNDGSLFMAGGTGSVADGYHVGGYLYTYAESDIALWGTEPDSILILADEDFDPPAIHEHRYSKKVTLPTCTQKGYTTHTCSCGDTFEDTYVDALGHKMQDLTCTACGYKSVDLKIQSVTLRPTCAGLYYSGSFYIEEGISVSRTGITVSLFNQKPVADNTDPQCWWTEGITSMLISNILKEDVPSNPDRASMPVYARAYAQLKDGRYVYSDVVSVNLRQAVEAADAQWSTLDAVQQADIMAMYTKFAKVLDAWELTVINATLTNPVLDVMLISSAQTFSNQSINSDVYITSTGVATFTDVTVNGNIYCYGQLSVTDCRADRVYAYAYGSTLRCTAFDGVHGIVDGSIQCEEIVIRNAALDYAFSKWGKR